MPENILIIDINIPIAELCTDFIQIKTIANFKGYITDLRDGKGLSDKMAHNDLKMSESINSLTSLSDTVNELK